MKNTKGSNDEIISSLMSFANANSFEKENERIERYLSEFTQRQGMLLTIAGLFSLFSIFQMTPSNILLIWAIPFLIFAIIFYILSSERLNFIISDSNQISPKEINEKLVEHYKKTSLWHRLTDSTLIIFFAQFIIIFSLITFFNTLTILVLIIATLSSLLLGFSRLLRSSNKSYKLFVSTSNSSSSKIYQVPAVIIPEEEREYYKKPKQ